MSLEDKIKYKADLDKMKRDIAAIKRDKDIKADGEWCHYSGMPSPEAYSQSNEALIARHKNKLSSEFQAKHKPQTEEDWGDGEDDGDMGSSNDDRYGRDYGDEDDGGDDSNEY